MMSARCALPTLLGLLSLPPLAAEAGRVMTDQELAAVTARQVTCLCVSVPCSDYYCKWENGECKRKEIHGQATCPGVGSNPVCCFDVDPDDCWRTGTNPNPKTKQQCEQGACLNPDNPGWTYSAWQGDRKHNCRYMNCPQNMCPTP